VQTEVEQKEWFTTDELVRWLGLGRRSTRCCAMAKFPATKSGGSGGSGVGTSKLG